MNKIFKSRSKIYRVWVGIRSRTSNNTKKHKSYKNIYLSEEWQEFENFYKDMYESFCDHINKHGEKLTTIERVDRSGNYCKENCIWATPMIQANNRSNNRYITYNNITKSCSEWARTLGLTRQAFYKRIELGWSLDKIFSTPKSSSLSQGRKLLLKELLKDVMSSKFGTKNRAELILRLNELIDMC